MLGRLKAPSAPTALLWLFAFAYGLATGVTPGRPRLTPHADFVLSITFPFLLAFWVTTDARARHRVLCYDFDTFVYFGWPVVIPIYLFQTRGIGAFLTLLCFAGLWVFAWCVAIVVSRIHLV